MTWGQSMDSFQEHKDNKTHSEIIRKMFGTFGSSEDDWKPCTSPQVSSKMQVSSPCIPCVLIRTSEAFNYPSQRQLPPPPVLVEEQEEWEVAQVLDSKLKSGKLLYLVEWKGFSEDPARTTWEPASNLTSHQTFSRISIDCIQTSLAQIPQEFDLMVLGGEKKL
ncbi:hypothetical protein O181_011390 [Austropuccinia psidii MF-1]|uniref:Chromo domain-containing protein n=1 Tax=Austropuccinia psidii MF-1 TaxID=1389203 RepID=A0A9Q3BVU0_9BASI|nr:hypothetical protein [Austropuccinia psidii MF-1]